MSGYPKSPEYPTKPIIPQFDPQDHRGALSLTQFLPETVENLLYYEVVLSTLW